MPIPVSESDDGLYPKVYYKLRVHALIRRFAPPSQPCTPFGRRREKESIYFDETYFSRLICGIGRPSAFNDSKQASTMLGLPHR